MLQYKRHRPIKLHDVISYKTTISIPHFIVHDSKHSKNCLVFDYDRNSRWYVKILGAYLTEGISVYAECVTAHVQYSLVPSFAPRRTSREVIRERASGEQIKLLLPRVSEALDEVSRQGRSVYRNKRE
jgi:hypothetical protein